MKTTPAPGVPILTEDPEPSAIVKLPTGLRMPRLCPEPGIYPNIPEAEYRGWAAVNQSLLKLLIEDMGGCPALARHYLDTCDDGSTDAQKVGTAYHVLALQGEKVFRARYPAIIPHEIAGPRGGTKRLTRSSDEWKNAVEAFGEGAVLWDDEVAEMRRMLAGLRAHPAACATVDGAGDREVCIVWDDPQLGLRCKARVDWLTDRLWADLKTCESASPRLFGLASAKYGYQIQCAWNLRGLEVLRGSIPPAVFIAQEKAPPYLIGVYVADPGEIANGWKLARTAAIELARCIAANDWPGYGDGPQAWLLPPWAGGPSRDEGIE